ncbi:hypothetical protein HYR99_15290 [Candidatus Poribacteria bacterium]|nr:hypothetical protein [Candidatus Poribacteria bacterium]
MNLNEYGSGHIESFLLNYELLVRDLAEVAADWPSLDDEERGHHRADFLQTWGNRKVLGAIFRAGGLHPTQEARLTSLDRLLLEQASLIEQCFSLDFMQLLAIFRWGTPLSQSAQTVHIQVESASLDRMAGALALSPHS